MSPYLLAHAAYHARGEPGIPWSAVIDFHFQTGVIISDPRVFVMARPVPDDLTVDEEVSLSDYGLAGHHGGTWHVWAAAGDLRRMMPLLEDYAIEELSFQRRGHDRLHRHCARRFYNLTSRLPNLQLI